MQGSPAQSDLCFPNWVEACWTDPHLGDTRATLKDTRKRNKILEHKKDTKVTRATLRDTRRRHKILEHKKDTKDTRATLKDTRNWKIKKTQKTPAQNLKIQDTRQDAL